VSRRQRLAASATAILAVPLAVVQHLTRQNVLDWRLAPTDRLMQRWTVSQGSGLPATVELARASRLSPLDDMTAVRVDQIVLAAPYRWPGFIHMWYRSPKPAEVIGQVLGISRTAVYTEHKVILGYLLGQFMAKCIEVPGFPGI
jgi:hypothetical protein